MAHKFQPQNFARLENPDRLTLFSPEALLKQCNLPVNPCLLDVGTGTGFYLQFLVQAAEPDGRVMAIDTSPEMLTHVKEKLNRWTEGRVVLVKGAEDWLPIPDQSADLAWLVFVFHELQNPREYLDELKRVLKPGGTICIVEWNKKVRDKGPPPEEVPSRAEMDGALRNAGFAVERSEELGLYCELLLARTVP